MQTAAYPTFGTRDPNATYAARRAAYVVLVRDQDYFAAVRNHDRHFLPGGGCLSGESPQQATIREVREELAREVEIGPLLGTAIQYFYSISDRAHYEMEAAFFRGVLGPAISASPEHQLIWLPARDPERLLYHACHAWAIRQALGASAINAA